MRLFYFLIICFIVTPLSAAYQCETLDETVLDAIVRVGGDNTEATGVVIDKNVVLTAAHVVNGIESSIRVGYHGYRTPATLIALFPEYDLALLTTDTGNLKPLAISDQALYPQEPVWTIGYPRAGNLTTATGIFKSNLEPGEIHVTAYVDSGQSGGGLLSCEYGQFVLSGMIKGFGAIDHGDHYVRLADYSVAVPASDIRSFVDQNQELITVEY